MNNRVMTMQHKTFDSLVFQPLGLYARGCRASTVLSNGIKVDVYGGLARPTTNGRPVANGIDSFDVRMTTRSGKAAKVPGYGSFMPNASPDDITCMMIHCQQHTRLRRWK